ncbi:MAG: PilN domain-containing protein [Fibrobacter sp.]|nr:PilN domain-containing protein [Fibrobacter sp.]
MVRINLLKNPSRSKQKKKLPVKAVSSVALIIAAGVCITFFVKQQLSQRPKASAKELVSRKEVEVTAYKPPAPVKSKIIEEVVREMNDSDTRKGILEIPYQEMAFSERVNYEVLFGKRIFEMLSRAVPDGIGLKTLELENFQTLYALGISNSKERITEAFNTLRQEQMELLPKPHSYIASDQGNGYRFVVTCKAELGNDHADQFQAMDHLLSRAELPVVLKKISDLAAKCDVKFKPDPLQLSAERVGAYRRFVYRFSGTSTYKDFVRLVLRLHNDKVPCAFKKITIKAKTESLTDVSAEVLLTFKE